MNEDKLLELVQDIRRQLRREGRVDLPGNKSFEMILELEELIRKEMKDGTKNS